MLKVITATAIALLFCFTSIDAGFAASALNSEVSLATNLESNLESGAAVFKANCAGCHARGGNIVRRGKNLKLKTLHKRQLDTEEAIASLVTNGKGIMSAYGDKLSSAEIADVSAYVLQRAEQGWKK